MIGAATIVEAPQADAFPGTREVTSRPLGLTPAAYAALLRALRFRYFKWDTHVAGGCRLLPEAIVLSRRAHDEVVRIVEGLHQGLGRFEQRVRRDPAALARLAIPAELHPLIAEEEHDTLQIARYDLFPTHDGRWMVSEFNEDVPGGFNEAVGIPELVGDPGGGLTWEGDLRGHFVRAFAPHETVAMLYATGFSEDLQHMLILERWLAEAGHRTLLGSPAHLKAGWTARLRPGGLRRGKARILGTPVDAAFRFYPAEWLPRLPNLDAWLRHGPRLPMMNPVHRLVRQSKLMFGLWDEPADLSAGDRALLDAHCPLTRPFTAADVAMLVDERERWVLKRAFGRMGDSVVIGALVPEAVWAASLAEAVRAPAEFCIQERFDVRPLSFEAGVFYPAVGAFLVNGRFAGYYSRVAPQPLITHEAFHVATLVEGA
jgi:glutathionylspermidine synthase